MAGRCGDDQVAMLEKELVWRQEQAAVRLPRHGLDRALDLGRAADRHQNEVGAHSARVRFEGACIGRQGGMAPLHHEDDTRDPRRHLLQNSQQFAGERKVPKQREPGRVAAGSRHPCGSHVHSRSRSLDYSDDVLERFDFIVASVHSHFRLDKKAQTERILRAVANPHTTVLGHMTGRMLLRRPGYEIDVERVFRACARHGVAVGINANPHRLDVSTGVGTGERSSLDAR